MLAVAVLTACSKSDDGGDVKEITLKEGTNTSQTIYADDTNGKDEGIEFNAAAPWTATVSAAVTSKASENDVEWLTLNAYSGGAGKQNLTMTILENTTGKDRKAEIKIDCGGTTISLAVEQKGVTVDNKPYDPIITLAGKGAITVAEIDTQIYTMMFINYSKGDTIAMYGAKNGKLSLEIPTPTSTKLENLIGGYFPSNFTISNSQARGVVASMECSINPIGVGEMRYTNAIDKNNLTIKEFTSLPELIYMDREATVKGAIYDDKTGVNSTYELKLKRGWNMLIETYISATSSLTRANNDPGTGRWVVDKLDLVVPSSNSNK